MLKKEQQEEIVRCAGDFSYFCREYVKVNRPMANGIDTEIVPFMLHGYQERLAEHVEGHRLTIFSKFRTGGFTTEMAMYGLWNCLFKLDQNVQWNSVNDRSAVEVGDLVKRAVMYLPDWMSGTVSKMANDHQKAFPETGSQMSFYAAGPHLARAATLLIMDEASHIPQMDSVWKAMWPVVSIGGKAVVMGTANHDTDWFWATLQNASYNLNNFSVFRSDWRECPWVADNEQEIRRNVGSRWGSEFEQVAADGWPNEDASPVDRKPPVDRWRSITEEFQPSMFARDILTGVTVDAEK